MSSRESILTISQNSSWFQHMVTVGLFREVRKYPRPRDYWSVMDVWIRANAILKRDMNEDPQD